MNKPNKDEISNTITEHVEKALKRTLGDDEKHKSVLDLGFNSLSALTLSSQLEDIFEIEIDPVDMLDYESIVELSDYVHSLLRR